jgi:predicted site-specific integrase-resolvase
MNANILNTAGAADRLGVAPATLAYWRSTGAEEVPYLKLGGRVVYRKDDLDKWISERVFTHTGQTKLQN